MVDLTAAPYHLDDEAIAWVGDTIAAMTDEEKIAQLFVMMGDNRDPDYLADIVTRYRFGGFRYNGGSASEVQEQNRILQTNSKIPLLIAVNAESGANGSFSDGTFVSDPVKLGAADDPRWGYELGRVSGLESAAAGCNWSFAPVVDILYNWRNPIISKRTFGNDPARVAAYGKGYVAGAREHGVVCAAKHFPGDGVDERDHHLSSAVNDMTVEQWDASFGRVYSELIEAGLQSIMIGHIMLPAYQEHFTPGTEVSDLMPATLSKEIATDLLRGKLGFNGLTLTDASHMVGLTGRMARRDFVPGAIAAGCDMFLFFNDPDEDLAWMMDGYRRGVITDERLNEALTRILGLKASLGLHRTPGDQIVPGAEALGDVGRPENKELLAEVSDAAITLVKNTQPDILPITPERYRRILIIPTQGFPSPMAGLFSGAGGAKAWEVIAGLLREAGHEVTIYTSQIERIMALPPAERMAAVMKMYSAKRPISELTDAYDLILGVADVSGTMQVVERVSWPPAKGTPDVPWYVHEIPSAFVSVNSPFVLVDVPQVPVYINTYDDKPATLEALVAKLASGADAFTGASPVDAFCGKVDTRI